MADLPSRFWAGWIVGITVIGFICLVMLVFGIYFDKRKNAHASEEMAVWDEDLREGSAAAPLWWFWLILSMMVFSVLYLMLYPGLGSFSGAFNWSQKAQLAEHTSDFNAVHDPARHALLEMSNDMLAQDDLAMSSAARLFEDNCAACHGADAKGQRNLFPNLRDGDWLWGSSPEQITQTINNGRNAVMVSWQPILGDEKVHDVAQYVKALGTPQAEGMPGQAVFNQYCFACHGLDGSGNQQLGAPRLNDNIWLYGGEEADLIATISGGRNGQMPAFGSRLDEKDVKLLVAWLTRPQ